MIRGEFDNVVLPTRLSDKNVLNKNVLKSKFELITNMMRRDEFDNVVLPSQAVRLRQNNVLKFELAMCEPAIRWLICVSVLLKNLDSV